MVGAAGVFFEEGDAGFEALEGVVGAAGAVQGGGAVHEAVPVVGVFGGEGEVIHPAALDGGGFDAAGNFGPAAGGGGGGGGRGEEAEQEQDEEDVDGGQANDARDEGAGADAVAADGQLVRGGQHGERKSGRSRAGSQIQAAEKRKTREIANVSCNLAEKGTDPNADCWKILAGFSNDWKNPSRVFQRLEKFFTGTKILLRGLSP